MLSGFVRLVGVVGKFQPVFDGTEIAPTIPKIRCLWDGIIAVSNKKVQKFDGS